MSEPTFTDPARVELLRAIGIWATVAGGIGLLLVGGELMVGKFSVGALAMLALTACGIGLLWWSRVRGAALWQANKPYLLSEHGVEVLHARRTFQGRTLWVGRVLLALFLITGITFFFFFSAISCGTRTDGYCGDVGTPSESLVVFLQVSSLALGGAWAAVVSWRRRHESQTELIDQVVAAGQRKRRSDDPMAGTGRFGWE